MNPLFNSRISFVLVGLSLSCLSIALVGASGPYVPAMYVFGDSLADAGTNNFIPHCTARANFTPYGVSYFPYPTGRFTNGRTTFDFLATSFLGLPYFLPPFLEPNSNFSVGVNFASGGSGLLDSTGATLNIIPMSTQVQQFENFMMKKQTHKYIGSENPKSSLVESLYCISIGGNDIFNYLLNSTFQNTTTPEQFVTSLLTNFNSYITRLYHVGARKFLVSDIAALGCTPIVRLFLGNGECLDFANQLAMQYNTGLKSLVDQLNQQMDGMSLILLNSYDFLIDMIQHGEDYGKAYSLLFSFLY
ncbi:GDSL esterase/lipase At2g23540-like [Cryptomeria japonica]|uniref:GDSL esterase/lipase At2g23540-like n=1 Tax=Cryptomeria japonica TaxID=3369 RepID=UPI0027DA5E67|nr:GDSL esterase/lipase At2g23540-like [Cryptomeria japonica]